MKIDLDPVTFEVLRHRLWSIHRELGATIKAMSGSPTASDGGDFNTAILDADGESLVIGVFVTMHAATQTSVIKSILSEYGRTSCGKETCSSRTILMSAPFISPMWCSLPRCSSMASGLRGLAARSIRLMLVVRCLEAFRRRRLDLRRARAISPGTGRRRRARSVQTSSQGMYDVHDNPRCSRLDLRAQVGANLVGISRIRDVAQRFGRDTMMAAFSGMMTFAEKGSGHVSQSYRVATGPKRSSSTMTGSRTVATT